MLRSRSKRLPTRHRARRLCPEKLETRRVLAGAIDVCLPAEHLDSADVPSEQWSPSDVKVGKNAAGHVVKPFRINGGGPVPGGVPLAPEVPAGFHSATGIASGLGRYTGEGALSLSAPLDISPAGDVTGEFEGTFVFTAANGDQLATIYGKGGTGTITGQLSADGGSVVDVTFDAFFSPDPENSTGRFKDVVGGGWRMIAKAESIPLSGGSAGYSGPFDYTWSGTGTLEYAKKSK